MADTRRKLPLLPVVLIVVTIIAFVFMQSGNEPELRFVSGTVYISGEHGQIIVRMADRDGNPLENALCTAMVALPDKTLFFMDRAMQASSIPGNYYTEFVTPQQQGLYEEIVRCGLSFNGNARNLSVSSSFQVSLGLSMIVNLTEKQDQYYNNLSERIAQLEGKLTAVNGTITQSFSSVGSNLTKIDSNVQSVGTSVTGRFTKYYSDMYNVSSLMAALFGNATP